MTRIYKRTLQSVFRRLLGDHGPQHWWPGESPFEVMVGAVLTQNTAWLNVEKAIQNLKREHSLDPEAICSTSHAHLAQMLQPSGYFNVKARRLRSFCEWYLSQGGYDSLKKLHTHNLRKKLLGINGVGMETADDILLYAFNRPVFVIDAYTRRIFSRYGVVNGDEPYDDLRLAIEKSLGKEVALYNEYHALIVMHGKDVCKTRPRCMRCCLRVNCKGRQ